MRPLSWVGLIVLVLGIASFFVSVPQKQRQGVKFGGASLGVETTTSQKLPPYISGILVVGGIVLLLAGGRGARA